MPAGTKASFYSTGTLFEALADADTTIATMTAMLASANSAASAASSSAAAASTSASSASTSLATFLASGGTATPLIDGTAAVGAATKWSREDHVHPTDTTRAPVASPSLTGTPTVPTAAVNTNTTQAASTAFVIGQSGTATPLINGTAAVGSATKFAREDHVHPTDTTRAPLASPTFTGTPAAPTATVNTNTTQLATTAFVVGQVGTATPLIDGTAAVGTSLLYARQDHVHPTDTTRAPLASPTFTGTPAAPTATAGTNTTQLATTAFVTAAVNAAGVASIAGNSGAFTLGTGLTNSVNDLRVADGVTLQTAYSELTTWTTTSAVMAGTQDTVPQQTDGAQFLTCTITPKLSTSKLLIEVSGPITASVSSNYFAALFQDATAAAITAVPLGAAAADIIGTLSIRYQMTSGTTSATTFKLRIGNLNGGAATIAVNGTSTGRRVGGVARLTMTVTEIKA